jgi:hypothetical protein
MAQEKTLQQKGTKSEENMFRPPILSTSKESKEFRSYIKSMLIYFTEAFVHLEFIPPGQPVIEM